MSADFSKWELGPIGSVLTFPWWQYFLLVGLLWLGVWATGWILGLVLGWRARVAGSALRQRRLDQGLQNFNLAVVLAVAISCFGLTVGIAAGNSRSPVTDVVITGAVTVYGALSTYWFSRAAAETRIIVSVLLVAFCLTVLYGLNVGGANRHAYEQATRYYEERLLQFQSDVELRAYDQKAAVDEGAYRRRALVDTEKDAIIQKERARIELQRLRETR